MIKKLLAALGISMMSALPMSQASPMSIDSEFSHFVPMEVKIDVSVGDSDKKDNKNNPPPTMRTEGKEDHTNKDKTNKSVNGNDNPPPPPSDKDCVNKPDSKHDEKLQPKNGKDNDSSVKRPDVKNEKDSKDKTKKKSK